MYIYIHVQMYICTCKYRPCVRRTKKKNQADPDLSSYYEERPLCIHMKKSYTNMERDQYVYIQALREADKKNKQTQTYLHMKRDLYTSTWKRAVHMWKETYMYIHRPWGRRTRRTSRPRRIDIWRETYKNIWKECTYMERDQYIYIQALREAGKQNTQTQTYLHMKRKKHIQLKKELYIYLKRHICMYTGPAWGGQEERADLDLSTYLSTSEERPIYIHEKIAMHIWKKTLIYICRHCVRRTRKLSCSRELWGGYE